MIVTDVQILAAMNFWSAEHVRAHGPLDGVSLPKKCSRLADLLGAMWYAKETQATIPDTSELAQLIAAAAPSDTTQAPHAPG
jgi:hypothetical protein